MEEEDKKAELNSEIWKKYEKKEAKNLKKCYILLYIDWGRKTKRPFHNLY